MPDTSSTGSKFQILYRKLLLLAKWRKQMTIQQRTEIISPATIKNNFVGSVCWLGGAKSDLRYSHRYAIFIFISSFGQLNRKFEAGPQWWYNMRTEIISPSNTNNLHNCKSQFRNNYGLATDIFEILTDWLFKKWGLDGLLFLKRSFVDVYEPQ